MYTSIFPEFVEDFKSCKRDAKAQGKCIIDPTWTPEITSAKNNFPIMPTYSPQVASSSFRNSNRANNNIKRESKNKIFEKAALLALKFKGECQSTSFSICKGKNSIKFKCQNNHTFFMPVETLETINIEGIQAKNPRFSSDCWCYKCKKFYETC